MLYGLLALLSVACPAAEPTAGQATALVPEPQTAAHAQAVDQAREFVREWMAENIHPPSEMRSSRKAILYVGAVANRGSSSW